MVRLSSRYLPLFRFVVISHSWGELLILFKDVSPMAATPARLTNKSEITDKSLKNLTGWLSGLGVLTYYFVLSQSAWFRDLNK